MARAATLLLPVLLAACAGAGVHALNAGENGVTFEFPLEMADEATREAQLYCANLGRHAERESFSHKGDDRAVASYECR